MAFIRGIDYSSGFDAQSRSLSIVERAFPLSYWAIACIISALILLSGMIFKWHFAVWAGHGLLWAIYGALCIGISASILTAVPMPPPGVVLHDLPWWQIVGLKLDGIRGASVLLLPTAFHFVLMIRTGPRPANPSDAEPKEVILAPSGK